MRVVIAAIVVIAASRIGASAASPSPAANATAPPGAPFAHGPFAAGLPTISPDVRPVAGSTTMIARAVLDPHLIGNFQIAPALVDGYAPETDYGEPVYYAASTDPAYVVHCRKPWGTCRAEGKTVRIPRGAVTANGNTCPYRSEHWNGDAHITVVQPGGTAVFQAWQSETPGCERGVLSISWGSIDPMTGDGLGGSSTASGFSSLVGQVTPDIVRTPLPYALFLATPCENGKVPPATGSDGAAHWTAGCPPIGARVHLKYVYRAQVEAIANPIERNVLLTLMYRGGYIGDETCSTCSLGVVASSGIGDLAMGRPTPWATIIPSAFGRQTIVNGLWHQPIGTGDVDLRSALEIIAP